MRPAMVADESAIGEESEVRGHDDASPAMGVGRAVTGSLPERMRRTLLGVLVAIVGRRAALHWRRP